MTLRSAIDAPKHLHDQIRADFKDMMHARTQDRCRGPGKRKAFLAKWRLRCRPVATSLEEAADRLFTFGTFVHYPPEQ